MPRTAVAMELSRDEMSEELRILYVAMTRAKQKLIMVATPSKGAASQIESASKRLAGQREIAPFAVRSAVTLSDWIVMCALLHPDGEPLREYAGVEADYEPQSSFKFLCRIINKPFDAAGEAVAGTAAREIAVDDSAVRELEKHADFIYPYDGLRGLPVKVAASTLAHRFAEKSYDRHLDRPAFMSDEKLTSAEKGTALHAFMQFADFARARDDIRSELQRLADGGYLTAAQADSVDIARAESFFNSGLISRCLESSEVYKEYRFNVRIPAYRVKPDIAAEFADEPVILQGAVDLAFVEDGEIVIVDYKTDRVKDPYELVQRYSEQLRLYKGAMEECLGLPVKECLIYSVRHNTALSIYFE